MKNGYCRSKIEHAWLNDTLFALGGWKVLEHSNGNTSACIFITNKENEIKHNEGVMLLIP